MADTAGSYNSAAAFLAQGGEMGALIRAFDWSRTPIGAVASWSPALRMMVSFLLANRFPLLLWWGPQYISIYNDAYRPILGTKHPKSMGQPVSECWSEIWHILKPLIDVPFQGGPATWSEDLELEVRRSGFLEETHFTVAYSPVPDTTAPRGIGGVLATVHEITEKVVGERRLAALRDLGARAAEAKTAEEACAIAVATLANHPKDIPFALLFLTDADGKQARLAGAGGVAFGRDITPLVVGLEPSTDVGWPLGEAIRDSNLVVVDNLGSRFAEIPPGPWSDPPRLAVVVPVRSNKANELAGFLVAGVSARLQLDDSYRGFLELVAAQIASALANARAYEEERRRAEALAEIDRAKTTFFSNVSHEFRTPLTLMLGPLEDVLAAPPDTLPQRREDLALVHRNSLRLLRLVNTLLDFSRIEAGRVEASYEPVDLPSLTADLASTFRAAIERAGLRLIVECPPFSKPVWVDREMWEKIVLNLISNAFKFTFDGEIAVLLRRDGKSAVLQVRDTGTGIPGEEIPRLFDRFHRVEGARGRTHEGTGIGLALVQELSRLHGGTVEVASVFGAGSTFSVTIPLGTAQDRVRFAAARASTALDARPFIAEALRWLPEGHDGVAAEAGIECAMLREPATVLGDPEQRRETILFADDNADMRDYVRHLLGGRYEVRTVGNGAAALAEIKARRPDLLLSDVMMPGLDGIGLLRQVREDPALARLPIILLSARAGEDDRIEGLDAAADDYLVKPFSARELVARVRANLERNKAEKATQALAEELKQILDTSATGLTHCSRELRYVSANPAYANIAGLPLDQIVSRSIVEVMGEAAFVTIQPYIERALQGERVEYEIELPWAARGSRWNHIVYTPCREADGTISGWVASVRDVTQRKRAEANLLGQKRILEMVATGAPLSDTLDQLMRFIEEKEPGARCSLLMVTEDGRHLRRGGGPSLPEIYHAAAAGAPITPPYFGTCGEAAGLCTGVSVPDLASETRYAPEWRALMLSFGLHSVRSTPVIGSNGRVLASLAVYYARPRDPVPADPDLIDTATQLAAIAIERDRAEHSLRDLNQTLERQVAERTRALQAEMAERQKVEEMLQQSQRLEAIGRLTGGVAHDFNNLLTVIVGQAESIIAAAGNERVAHMALAARRAAERGAQLTSQLLSFSRKQLLQPVTAAVQNLILDIGELVRRAVGETIAVDIDTDPELWSAHLDPAQFEAVILNLAINSRDAMPDGGRIGITGRNATVTSAEAAPLGLDPGDYIVVSVADTGRGMTPEVRRRAFEPFFTTKDVGQGTGLGLAQIYGFAKQSGGTAMIDSVVGAGTTVALYLPKAAVAGDADARRTEPHAPVHGHGRTILVVEDQPEVREIIEAFLEGLDFRVLNASDGPAARRLLESNETIDLLLTDVVMPNGVSGLELARDARRLRQDLKIVVVSGFLRDADSRGGDLTGLIFLEKPFRRAELVETIAAVLGEGGR